jgi:alkyl sulfatase BDS1-like metallo-beta-lactamase superfamily hydrolase
MKIKKVITLIVAALAFTMTGCGSSTAIAASELTAESKPATQYTIDANQEVYALLDFEDTAEFENATKGLLASPDTLDICAAQELRNGTNTDDATRSSGNGDVFLHMTPDMILDYLGIFVDTTKISDLTFTANIILPEGNYVLRVKNGVLLYQKDAQDADADVTWTTKRAGLLSIVQKNAENVAALIEQEGDETCLTRLMDAVTVTSEYKYFNIIEP